MVPVARADGTLTSRLSMSDPTPPAADRFAELESDVTATIGAFIDAGATPVEALELAAFLMPGELRELHALANRKS